MNKRDRERIWRANMCIRECFVWSRWLIYTHRNDEYSASECLPPHSMGWKKLSHMPSWCEHTKQKKTTKSTNTLAAGNEQVRDATSERKNIPNNSHSNAAYFYRQNTTLMHYAYNQMSLFFRWAFSCLVLFFSFIVFSFCRPCRVYVLFGRFLIIYLFSPLHIA